MWFNDEDLKIIEEGIKESFDGFFEYNNAIYWEVDGVLCSTTKEVFEEMGKVSDVLCQLELQDENED